MGDVLRSLRDNRVVVIYRGQTTQQCLELSRTLYEGGVRLFEVTLNSERPLESIRALRAEFGSPDSDVRIGAGTVVEPEQVARVADAGAEFVISPDLHEAVVERTKEAGLVSVPGAFTPSEVQRAVRAGADMVKVFPIRPVGADYIRQLRGPLADVPIVATGGVDAELAGECFAAGADGVGVGVQLFGERALSGDGEELRQQAGRLLAAAERGRA